MIIPEKLSRLPKSLMRSQREILELELWRTLTQQTAKQFSQRSLSTVVSSNDQRRVVLKTQINALKQSKVLNRYLSDFHFIPKMRL
jgi:translation initiation factor 2 beta subunit (eIF-2beta)/eIF-5